MANLGSSTEENIARVLDFLKTHGPATIRQTERHFNCDRAGAILNFLLIKKQVMASSQIITGDTVFSLPATAIPVPPPSPIDVVYPLGRGSKWQDNELRYSLRSLVQHFPDLGRVFVVGEKPAWLTKVVHIPHPDRHKHNKDANIIEKVLAACAAGISEKFVFMSDDQLFLRPVRFSEMTPLHLGDLAGRNKNYWKGKWKQHLKNTVERLRSLALSTLHFDSHCPTPIERDKFVAAASAHPFREVPFTINTLYVNAAKIPGRPRGDRKITLESPIKEPEKIREMLNGPALYLGFNDGGLTPALKTVLAERFPDKSPYEAPLRGIVTLAGGPIYATNAFINCRMLRQLGCTLPIEWCYLGAEMSPAWLELIRRTIPDVRLVDLGGRGKNNRKGKGGWQAKIEAVLQSQFDELLFLDADSFPLRDPAPLFDHRLFREHDCVFWPDLHAFNARQKSFVREKYGLALGGQQIESGQMLVRKRPALAGLLKTREMNRESALVYRHLHGDKDTFLIGASLAGVKYALNPHRVRRCGQRHLLQHDLDGGRMFCHLTGGKWEPRRPAPIDARDYPHFAAAERIWRELIKTDAALEIPARMELNMHVRDSFCAIEAARIVNEDTYKIRPMIGHRLPVKYIVDIGGNAGAFTFAAAAAYPDAEILVIEPDPELMADIRYNLRGLKAKVHFVEAACVDHPTPFLEENGQPRVTFVRRASHRAGSFVRHTLWGQAAELADGDEELAVAAVTLPALLAEHRFPQIDILKIDAEGVEGEILTSLKSAGWMPRVHWIRGEWHGRADWPAIEAALRETHEFALEPNPENGEMIAHNRQDV